MQRVGVRILPAMGRDASRNDRDRDSTQCDLPLDRGPTCASPAAMDKEKEPDWNALLKDHPIFSLPKSVPSTSAKDETPLQFSLSALSKPKDADADSLDDGPAPSGRRQIMVIKDSELVVAAGSELRMTTLADTKFGRATPKSYKVRWASRRAAHR